MINKYLKQFYILLTLIFTLLTLIEFISYLKSNSNFIGLFYLPINFFIVFLLSTITINYKKSNIKLRISKNILSIILGLTSIFILPIILNNIFTYDCTSTFHISKILKTIIYFVLTLISYIEIKELKKQK